MANDLAWENDKQRRLRELAKKRPEKTSREKTSDEAPAKDRRKQDHGDNGEHWLYAQRVPDK